MPAPRTFEEHEENPPPLQAVLSFIVRYDDLLADQAFSTALWEQPLSIGRGDERAPMLVGSELRLPDAFLSGRHAVIERVDSGHVLSDEGSRNGTFVGGARVTRRVLVDGDLIELGRSLLCYRVVPAPLAALLAGSTVYLGPTFTRCPEVVALCLDLSRIAPSVEPVLLLGETGTGKEVVARMIHEMSGRSGPLVSLDCGAIPESLFESTLFGHRRGSFTGADKDRIGEMVRATGGTLFLDEIGNLPPSAQAKLLRALETRRVVPLGASEEKEVDVRFIAATNQDLFAEAAGFRPDLLRRLSGYIARLPPLRARREDLGTLSAWLLRDAGVEKAAMTLPAGRRLFLGDFPGNVRELRSVLRSAALLAAGGPIQPGHLMIPKPSVPNTAPTGGTPGAEALAEALQKTGGNVVQAARLLNTHPRQVYRWIERHGLDLEELRRR